VAIKQLRQSEKRSNRQNRISRWRERGMHIETVQRRGYGRSRLRRYYHHAHHKKGANVRGCFLALETIKTIEAADL